MKKVYDEIYCWFIFIVRRLFEIFLLAGWILMTWALEVYVVKPFPISGLPKYVIYGVEIIFAIVTLIELVRNIFDINKTKNR